MTQKRYSSAKVARVRARLRSSGKVASVRKFAEIITTIGIRTSCQVIRNVSDHPKVSGLIMNTNIAASANPPKRPKSTAEALTIRVS